MIPITREELYLNKIVGNDDYDIPEKPITEEEFFFAEILGEAVQAPEPLTRYQLYLAKIAGKNIEIPYPETRLEYFLARAAGMDVETPAPITREEIYWSNYTATTEFELEGVPPLIFKSDGSVLKNYRVYGAVGGVGDYDESSGKYVIPVTIAGKNKFDGTLFSGYYTDSTMTSIGGVSGNYKSCKVYLSAGTYTFSCSIPVLIIRYITADSYKSNPTSGRITQTHTFTVSDDGYVSLAFRNAENTPWDGSTTIQIEEAQTATEYEPYHEPIVSTISLETPLSEGESVSMAETGVQFGTIDGTNILTVGTEVQPSKVYLKGKIEEIPTRTVSYYSQDGSTLLGTETVESGGNASGLQDTPTKPDTEQYTYTFVGWSNTTNATTAMSGILNNITADKSVYAAFSETEKTFTVTFYNGAELIYTAQNVSYNGTAVYSGTTPTKAETSEYTYTFAGWNTNSSASTADADALTNVTADRTVYAIFTAVPKGYTVYFYNGETLLKTVTGVPSGGTATYTGATPTSSQAGYIFSGWSPSNTNITADTSCYAQFEAPYITDSWEVISQRSAAGTAQNYYSVGDCKPIELNGTMGTLALNTTLYVYILGFNHNSTYEPNGITFGCFKTAATNGIDVCLVDSKYGSSDTSGTKYFNMSHRDNYNYGGWKGSDMRYDILGSTNVQPSGNGSAKVGHDATSTCATTPVANTLMSCLPSGLRSVMKPMTKYTDAKGNSSNVEANVTTSIDYLPLLSEYEVQGTGIYANKYEKNKQAQYTYYSGGNSKVKYSHSATSTAVMWWMRSPYCNSNNRFCRVGTGGGISIGEAGYSNGVAPCFLV